MKKYYQNEYPGSEKEEGIRIICIIGIVLVRAITKNDILFLWGMELLVQEILLARVYEVYRGQLNEFPEKSYCQPKYLVFLFRHAYFNVSYVPKIAVLHMYLSTLIAVLLNGMLILIVVKIPGDVKVGVFFIVFLFGMGLEVVLMLLFGMWATKICFLYKFKKLNWKNVKYLIKRLSFVNAVEKEPRAFPVGKCIIADKKNKRRGKVATVTLVKGKGTLTNVLLTGDRDYKDNEVYKLYEICGVKYID